MRQKIQDGAILERGINKKKHKIQRLFKTQLAGWELCTAAPIFPKAEKFNKPKRTSMAGTKFRRL